jgi:putative oxidoreductase
VNTPNTAPYGALLLRVALGVMFLAHSAYLKLVVFTLPGTVKFYESIGLPGIGAHATVAVEVIAGLMLIVGYRTRIAALATLPVLLGATWVHWGNGWLFTNAGGGWEYPLFLAAAAGAQALLGDGAFALSCRAPVRPPHRVLARAAADGV